MAVEWVNWSGTVRCAPARCERPGDEAEIADALRRAGDEGRVVRVAGRRHSHAPLVATDGVVLSLEHISGLEAVDAGAREATVRAGTVLHDLGAALGAHGFAMQNLGDVDVQALAGAIATGTHGTGRSLGNLSTQVTGLRLVTARGEVRTCSESDDPQVFAAARLSLGALGVVTAVRLRLLPAYRLHERIWREDVEPCLERLAERIAATRHFEFFWLPHRDRVECKALHPTDAAPGTWPERRERIGDAASILPSVRDVKHVEIEYALPAESGPACFRAIRECLRSRHGDVLWPVEYRTLAADEIPLSPAFGRDTVTISLHQGEGLPYQACFADAESIFREFDGRPHWGKWHRRTGAELAGLYPRWEAFHGVRRALDPEGRFLSAPLRSLFDEGGGEGGDPGEVA